MTFLPNHPHCTLVEDSNASFWHGAARWAMMATWHSQIGSKAGSNTHYSVCPSTVSGLYLIPQFSVVLDILYSNKDTNGFLSDVLKRQLPWWELASHFCQCEGRGGCIELEKNALEVASLLASLLAHYLLKRRFTGYHGSIPYFGSNTTSVFVFCLLAINIHRAGLPQIAITMKVSHWNLLVDNTSVATPLLL